ncbi:MAG TPA: glycogen-binding domain-containing protein [Candidatus Eisenbacteria bacterium]|nr:glycogen-binding domain-containing protein [Candidatus Eisenbacteria bacterium]
MKRRVAFCVLLAPILASPALAQWRATTGVAASYDSDLPGASFRLAPTFALDGQRAVLVGTVMASGFKDVSAFRATKLSGGYVLDPIRRLPIELKALVAHRVGPGWSDRGLARAEARLHFATRTAGAWMGLATEQAFGLTGQLGDRPLIGFGTWTRHRGLTVSLDLEQRSGLLPDPAQPPPRDSVKGSGPGVGVSDEATGPGARNQLLRVALTTTRVSAHWQSSRLELESVAGVTLSLTRGPRRWAQATAAYAVAPNLAAFATFGSRDPELYLIEPAETPRATCGVRLSHWRSTVLETPLVARATATKWHVRRVSRDSWSFDVRAPGARMVEMTGDFTRWEPIQLQHQGGDRWSAIMILEPGVHQVNLRIDGGAWMPPPGAPTSVDGYGGTTGVVVAE